MPSGAIRNTNSSRIAIRSSTIRSSTNGILSGKKVAGSKLMPTQERIDIENTHEKVEGRHP